MGAAFRSSGEPPTASRGLRSLPCVSGRRALGDEVSRNRNARGRGALRSGLALAVVAGSVLSPTAARAADDGMVQIAQCGKAQPKVGSSNPTFYSNNHRMVVTDDGRVIAVYDGHGSGQQIRWRNRGGSWQGNNLNGYIPGDFPNDRTASLAIFGSGAEEQALLVWSGYALADSDGEEFSSTIQMVRLTDLDATGGPTIGPVRTLQPPGANMRVDVAVQGGTGVLAWTRRNGTSFEVVAATLDANAAAPALSNVAVLYSNADEEATATLVPASGGVRAVVANGGDLEMWTHGGGASWTKASASASVSSSARPSAAVVGGDVLVAADSSGGARVHNLTGSGNEGSLSGDQPTIATNGTKAWVFSIDSGDLVSHELSSGDWSGPSVEIAGQGHAWPNALRDVDDGKLRVLLDGTDCPDVRNQNPVLYYERPAAGGSTPPPSGDVRASVGDVSVTEGNSGSVTARFRLSLSEAASRRVTVRYQTVNGSAVAPGDYTAKSGTLSFTAGTTNKTVGVAVRGDGRNEPNEHFFLELSNPNGATLGSARGVATIVDNDAARARATVKVRRLAKRLAVSGTVRPSLAGRHVTLTLFRKRHGRFVKVAVKTPVLRESLSAGTRSGVSAYKTRVRRPKRGRCKVVTKVPRRGDLRGTKAIRFFRC